jgi:hypothetical protein
MVKTSAQARRAKSKSHYSVGGAPLVAPMLNTVERPITTEELAQHLRVTTRTIATYRAQRLIPFMRLNARRILYRLSAVEAALNRNNV